MSCRLETPSLPKGFVHVLGSPSKTPEESDGNVRLWTWDPKTKTPEAKLQWVQAPDVDLGLLPVLRDEAAADKARVSLEDAFKFPVCGELTSKAVLVGERWVSYDVLGDKLFKEAVRARTKAQQTLVKSQVENFCG